MAAVVLPVVSERWLERVLLRAGAEARVLDPPELVDTGRLAAARLLARLRLRGAAQSRTAWRLLEVGDAGLGEEPGQHPRRGLGVGQGVVGLAARRRRSAGTRRRGRGAAGGRGRASGRAGACRAASARVPPGPPGGRPGRGRPSRTGRGARRRWSRRAAGPASAATSRNARRPPGSAPRDAVHTARTDAPRPDVGAPSVDDGAVTQHGDHRDLQDAVPADRQPTRLDVDHGEALAVEWERVGARGRAPAGSRLPPYAGGARGLRDRPGRRRRKGSGGGRQRRRCAVTAPAGVGPGRRWARPP